MKIVSLRIVVVLSALSAFAWCAAARLSADPITGGDLGATTGVDAKSQEIADAVARFKDRDFDGALKLLKEAVKKNADLPPAQVILAQLFSQANIPMGVRNALEQTVVESADDPEAYVIMGDIALRERQVTAASLLYAKAASLMAKFDKSAKRKGLLQPRVYSGLASVAEARADWAGAQKQLETWLTLEPKSALAMQRLARCLFQQKKPTSALAMLRDAAKADPEVLTPEAILAGFYERADPPDRENANKSMAAALVAAPKDIKTWLVAGQHALETGQLEEAQKRAAFAMDLDAKSLDAKILRGVIALFQKDYKAAELYFESAHLQSPINFAASNNLALALIEQKDESKKRRALEYAEANARQFQKNSPNYAEAASTYGWALYKLGRMDEAEQALRAAASGGTFSADTAYYIARVSADRGRESEAKVLLENALKSTGPFSQRQEAKALLERLKK